MLIAHIEDCKIINVSFEYSDENLIGYGYNLDYKEVPKELENKKIVWDSEENKFRENQNKKFIKQKINKLLDFYVSLPLGLQAQYINIRNEIEKKLNNNDLESVSEILNTIVLPIELEEYRQRFINILIKEE